MVYSVKLCFSINNYAIFHELCNRECLKVSSATLYHCIIISEGLSKEA